MKQHRVLIGDCIESMRTLQDQSIHTCVTSPPYFGLRDYGMAGQIGLEETPAEFIARLVEVFREVRRVLRNDGTLWVNMGDTYASIAGVTHLVVPLANTTWSLRLRAVRYYAASAELHRRV